GLRLSGLVARKAFDKPMNAATFEEWVEKCLVPTLSPGDVVVMDNLSSHKGPRVEQLIEAAGAELRYLPPYSPDMNPIEKAFSKLKAFLRKISERTVAGLMNALETCAHIFQPVECVNYLKACGYDTDLIGVRSKPRCRPDYIGDHQDPRHEGRRNVAPPSACTFVVDEGFSKGSAPKTATS